MARRGEKLREHILLCAKEVFLDLGFERATMDAVASRAETSKRSLYAHFDSKERLFSEVIAFVRELVLEKIGSPADYADEPADALARFCGRYLEILLYQGSIKMCRVIMTEAARFPDGAQRFHDMMFTEIAARLCGYLAETFDLTEAEAATETDRLLGRILYPGFPRALFGIDPLTARIDLDCMGPDIDLAPIRAAVADLLGALRRR